MVVIGALSLQFGAALAVILIGRTGAVGAVTLRLILAALLLLTFVRPRLSGRSPRDLSAGVAFGIALAVMNLCFYQAAARLPLGAAVTLEFLGPLGLAVVTSRRRRDLIWVLSAGAGVWLLSEGGLERLSPAGVGFALGAALSWAFYILLGARVGRTFPGAEGLVVALLVGSLGVVPLGLLTQGATLLAPDVLVLGLGVAALSSALPYSLELAALRRVPARTFGILMSLQPAVAALAGFVVLRQRLSGWQIVAIGLVILASAGATASAGASRR